MIDAINYFLWNSYHVYTLIAELIFVRLWERRGKFKWRLLILIPYIVIPYFGLYKFSWFGSWFDFSYLLTFVVSVGVIAFLYRLSVKELFYYCVTAFTVQHTADCVARIAYFTIVRDFTNYIEIVYHCIEIIAHLAVYVCAYFVIRKRINRGDDVKIEGWTVIVLSFVSLVILIVLNELTFLDFDEHYYIIKLYDFVCCFLLIFVQLGLFLRGKQIEKTKILESIIRTERAQNDIKLETVDVINRKCHDLKHQIGALKYVENKSDRDRNIAEIEDAVMIYDSFIKTGNRALDVVLTQKSLCGEQYDIKFACMVDGAALGFIDDTDLYSLFGNILDNAIEAVKAVDKEKRIINVTVAYRNGFPYIHVENSFIGQIVFRDGFPITSKGDSDYHGFGVRSIDYIAQKYGGTMTIAAEDGLFEINIVFMNRHEQKSN